MIPWQSPPELETLADLWVLDDAMPSVIAFFAAGGYFVDAQLGLTPRDIDLFFRSEDDWARAVIWAKEHGCRLKYATKGSTCVTWTRNVDLDLVSCRYGTPEAILRTFDFRACQFGWDRLTREFGVGWKALDDLRSQTIWLTAPYRERPLACLAHVGRYLKKGFTIDARGIRLLADARERFEAAGIEEPTSYGELTEDQLLALDAVRTEAQVRGDEIRQLREELR